MSRPQLLLGPLRRRYRTSVSALATLWYLSIGPLMILGCALGALLTDRTGLWFAALTGIPVSLIGLVFVLWAGSAYLEIREYGVVVGRSLFSTAGPREMRFTEIHPASLRVFSSIDDIRPFRGGQRMLSTTWHFSPGADLAVTFLGPDRDSVLTAAVRGPAPSRGLVIFGSRDAVQIAAEIRAGLERAGCPPHLARWSAQFGVQEIRGSGSFAQGQLPGRYPDWTS